MSCCALLTEVPSCDIWLKWLNFVWYSKKARWWYFLSQILAGLSLWQTDPDICSSARGWSPGERVVCVDPCVHICSWCYQVLLSLCFPCSQSNKTEHTGDPCIGCLRGRTLTLLLVLLLHVLIERFTCCFPSVGLSVSADAVAVVKLLRVPVPW